MKRDEFKNKFDLSPEEASIRDYVVKLERENEVLKRQTGTDKRLFDYIKNEIKSFEPSPPVQYDKPSLAHDDLHVALKLTDAHAEEIVRAEEMEGLAEYNWQIFTDRMAKTAQKTIELVNIMRQASNVPYLDVDNLGDWVTGKILPQEEGWGTSMPFPVAVPRVGQELGRFLVSLAPHFEKIRVNCLCGNHGRDSVRPVFKMTADRNWDMSVYLIAQGYTEQCKNIEWNIPQSIMTVVDVMGWKCLLSHSMEVQMTHRTPYYPIETTVDMEHKVRAGTDKDFDYVFMGHWHHYAVIDNSIIICPCMIGPNQFSRFRLHRRSKPEQLLCFFTEKHGLINQWPIAL